MGDYAWPLKLYFYFKLILKIYLLSQYLSTPRLFYKTDSKHYIQVNRYS